MEMYIGIAIDLLLCLCVLLFVISTAKKGFALTFFNILAFFGAFVLAAVIAKNLSGFIFDRFFAQSVIEKIENATSSIFSGSSAEEIKNFVSKEFPFLFNFSNISGLGIDTGAVSGAAAATATNIAETLIRPIFVSLISIILYIISLIICLPILRWIAKLISSIFTISLIGTINSILGGILGFVKGVVIVFLICSVAVFAMSIFVDNESVFSHSVQNSFIINLVSDIIL